MVEIAQKLPASGSEREALREKGQFWTPAWAAQAMAAYPIAKGYRTVFDPAVGAGAFFRAALAVAELQKVRVQLHGTEIDQAALKEAEASGLSSRDLSAVEIRDFVLDPPKTKLRAVVANPPYIRHHRLPADVKRRLRAFSMGLTGIAVDARAGYHIYFLLRALQLLEKNGRLAFIMPAGTCEGIFAAALWQWITAHYRLDAVITFDPQASPFPGVDTNPVVFMIEHSDPKEEFYWVRVIQPDGFSLRDWVLSGFNIESESFSAQRRLLREGIATGLSRPPRIAQHPATLGDFATVMRGIATGANEYFFLTTGGAAKLKLPKEFLITAIGRTRDVAGAELTRADIQRLDGQGRPTLLFSPDGRPLEKFPATVRRYLKHGEKLGLPDRALIKTRNPWYKMETRRVPPFLFAYLGRRNARFIRNRASAVPLTGFLCVYPKIIAPGFIARLWVLLKHPDTVANLGLVGKSYGAGAVKVEPRALERLPLTMRALQEANIALPARTTQLEFCLAEERARYRVKRKS